MTKSDIEVSIWIARSPEEIWDFLCDASNDVLWRYGIYLGQWISEPPYGVGSNGFHIVSIWGDCPWIIAEWEELCIMSWDFTDGGFKGVRSGYRIAPEDTGSRVTMHTSVKSNAFMRIMVFLMKRFIRRNLAGDLERLKAIMEAQTPSN